MAKAHWIQKAIGKHKGGLHRSLGLKGNNPLTEEEMDRALRMGGKAAKEARLAKTLKGFHKK